MKNKKSFKRIEYLKKCRICNSKDLYKFLDLESMPIPNGFIRKEDIVNEEPYELACYFCKNCGLVQLTNVVHPEIMFRNYVYIPSTSKLMMNNFSNLAASAKSKKEIDNLSFVIDIGSNDGSLLKFFQRYGAKVLGIDPAENIAEEAMANGVPTETWLFNKNAAQKVVKKYGKADVITATNVIAHIDDLHQVMEGVSVLLKNDGIFITEFPYLLDLVTKNQFDTIYHEHLSYFSIGPWDYLISQYGFEIIDIERTFIQGGSIRITHARKGKYQTKDFKTAKYLKSIEKQHGLYSPNSFDEFSNRVYSLREELRNFIFDLKKKGKRVIGYGAAAKGNVLTNFFDLGSEYLEYILDSTPHKVGLLTPGKHIPVIHEKKLLEDLPDYALILAWNFADEIIEKNEKYIKKGGHFIIPIPYIKVV